MVQGAASANTPQYHALSTQHTHAKRYNGRLRVPNWHCQCTYTPPCTFARSVLTCLSAAQPAVRPQQYASPSAKPNVSQTQDRCEARRQLHHHGMAPLESILAHVSNRRRLLVNLASERRPSSTRCSPPPSRTMPTTSAAT